MSLLGFVCAGATLQIQLTSYVSTRDTNDVLWLSLAYRISFPLSTMDTNLYSRYQYKKVVVSAAHLALPNTKIVVSALRNHR